MPPCYGSMVFGNTILFNLDTDYVLLKVASLALLKVGSLIIILIIFGT
jgi:hypothetical protein